MRNLFVFVSVIVLVSLITCPAQASTAQSPRVLLIGDSWAMFLSAFRSFPEAYYERGLTPPEILSLYWPGSEASDWNSFFPKLVLAWTLDRYPSIEVVIISLGGNDLLGDYHVDMSLEEREALYSKIHRDLEALVFFLQSQKPGLAVVLSGYDYVNFVNSVNNIVLDTYRRHWIEAGKPNAEEVNAALIRLGLQQQAIADAHENVHFVNNFGLMQWAFGYPAIGLGPGLVPPPALRLEEGISPGGNPRLPSPPEAMLSVWFLVDAIHLNRAGYRLIAGNLIDRALCLLLDLDRIKHGTNRAVNLRAALRRPRALQPVRFRQ